MIITYTKLNLVDNDLILAYCDRVKPFNARYQSKLAAQTGGFATNKTDYIPKELKQLIDIVSLKLEIISGEYRKLKWWVVGLPSGASINMHDHIQSDWSAVYYPMQPSVGGKLVFEYGQIIEPSKGMLVCFPGHAVHGVTKYDGLTDRISIAFNRAKS